MDQLAEFFGRLHPVILHFPLVLLVVGSVVELFRCFRDSPFLAQAVRGLFGLGVIAAFLAVGSGWLLAAHEHIRSDQKLTLEWHRWLGVATAVVSCLAWFASISEGTPSRTTVRRCLVILCALLVLGTGYFGGELVWGRDWFQLREKTPGE